MKNHCREREREGNLSVKMVVINYIILYCKFAIQYFKFHKANDGPIEQTLLLLRRQ